MHLDGGLVLAELGPREQRQAQVDGRGIQRVESVIQCQAEWIFGVKQSRYPDQIMCEVAEDAPVVCLVSIGQRGPRHLAAKAEMIQLSLHRPQARFDIPQAFAVSELSEGHCQILIPTREAPVMVITVVTGYTFLKLLVGKMRDQFGEHEAASIHSPLLSIGC